PPPLRPPSGGRLHCGESPGTSTGDSPGPPASFGRPAPLRRERPPRRQGQGLLLRPPSGGRLHCGVACSGPPRRPNPTLRPPSGGRLHRGSSSTVHRSATPAAPASFGRPAPLRLADVGG